MKVTIGTMENGDARQGRFPDTCECDRCGDPAAIAFVAREEGATGPLVRGLHRDGRDKGERWLTGSCSVAVYVCRTCLRPTAVLKQG